MDISSILTFFSLISLILIFSAIAIAEFYKRKEIKKIENNPEFPKGLAERMINTVKKKYDDQLWVLEIFRKFFSIFKIK